MRDFFTVLYIKCFDGHYYYYCLLSSKIVSENNTEYSKMFIKSKLTLLKDQ